MIVKENPRAKTLMRGNLKMHTSVGTSHIDFYSRVGQKSITLKFSMEKVLNLYAVLQTLNMKIQLFFVKSPSAAKRLNSEINAKDRHSDQIYIAKNFVPGTDLHKVLRAKLQYFATTVNVQN